MPAVRGMAADLLGRLGDPATAGAIEPLLADEDAAVRASAVRALGQLRPEAVDALAARLAEDPAAAVRAELAVALAGAGEVARADELLDGLLTAADPDDRAIGLAASARAEGPRLAERATHGLADGSSRVRAAAAEAFAPALHAEGTDEPAAIALLVAALDDEALAVRRAAAQTLAGHDLAAAAMVEVLSSGSERAQEAAVRGLEGTGTEMIEPVRAWAHERIARVTRLRVHAAALQPADPSGIGAPDRASIEFLCGLIGRRERRTEAQLLTAIATLGAPEATGLLRRSLRAPDPDVRAQAIEALDALGDHELGREVVGLLDTEVLAGNEATDDALRSLGDDPDPWIRCACPPGDRRPHDRGVSRAGRRCGERSGSHRSGHSRHNAADWRTSGDRNGSNAR